MDRSEDEDEALVLAARHGDDRAFAELVDRWLDRCWEVAWRILRDRDLAADVAQETLATAWERLATLDQPGSFGGWVLRIARNRALNRLDRERRTVTTADEHTLEPTDRLVAPAGPDDLVERDERSSLLWAAAAALGPRDTSVLDLHLRHGMGPAELAEALDVTANNAHQLLFRLRSRLGGAIRARVLWRDGAPRCRDLADVLRSAGVTAFGPAAVRTISRHAERCATCEDERAAVLAPAALFGAVPLVAMPAGLRSVVLERLDGNGVPVPEGALAVGGPSDGPDDGSGVAGPGGGARPSVARDAAAPRGRDRPRLRHRPVALAAAAVVLLVAVVAVSVVASGGDGTTDTLALGADADATTADTAPTSPGADDATSPALGPPTAPEVQPLQVTPVDETEALAPPSTDTTTGTATGPEPTGAAPTPAPSPPPPPPTTLPSTSPPTRPTTTVPAAPTAELTVVDAPQPSCSLARRVMWTTTGATTVTLSVAGEPPVPVASDGSTTLCEAPGQPVVLTAAGPGGRTVAEATT